MSYQTKTRHRWTEQQDAYLKDIAASGLVLDTPRLQSALAEELGKLGPPRTRDAIVSRFYALGLKPRPHKTPGHPPGDRWTPEQVDFLKEFIATGGGRLGDDDLAHLGTLGPPRTRGEAEGKLSYLKGKAPKPTPPPGPIPPPPDPTKAKALGVLVAVAVRAKVPDWEDSPDAWALSLKEALARAWVDGLLPPGMSREVGLGIIEDGLQQLQSWAPKEGDGPAASANPWGIRP